MDLKEQIHIYDIGNLKHKKCINVRITKNMSLLLYHLLTSLHERKGGGFDFVPNKESEHILTIFNHYDIVDTFNKLELDPNLFGVSLSDTSYAYVRSKFKTMYDYKTKARKCKK